MVSEDVLRRPGRQDGLLRTSLVAWTARPEGMGRRERTAVGYHAGMRASSLRPCLGLCLIGLLVAPRSAFAVDDDERPWTPPNGVAPGSARALATGDDGFGGQVVAADVLAMLVGGTLTYKTRSAIPFVVIFAMGAPFVHLGHRDERGAARSFALNAALPIVMEFIAAQFVCSNYHEHEQFVCERLSIPVAGLAGALPAMIIDAAALSHPQSPSRSVAFAPLATARDGHVGLALVGRF
jgi:hypothetical protein